MFAQNHNMATIEASRLFPDNSMNSSSDKDHDSAVASSPENEGGFRNFVRRVSHSFSQKNDPADVEKLVQMGFPRGLSERQLSACNGNVKQAAEYMVHAAHPPCPKEDLWNHPDCPICVREANNVRIANARAPSLGNVLERIRSRDSAGEPVQTQHERRGSVGAMLRRPSISAALARMTSRDAQAVNPSHISPNH